ncbi:hypothetical protein ACFX2J_014717 [Malus domestica]
MEKFFSKEWKILGIYDVVKPSTIEIAMDKKLLMVALGFWCSATNIMVLLLGPISPTILDISAILRVSPSGLPIDVFFSRCPSNLDLKILFDECAVELLRKKN